MESRVRVSGFGLGQGFWVKGLRYLETRAQGLSGTRRATFL